MPGVKNFMIASIMQATKTKKTNIDTRINRVPLYLMLTNNFDILCFLLTILRKKGKWQVFPIVQPSR
jgi:hypothetical protein